VLGGVFDAYPRLKVILEHLGETLPFLPRGLLRPLLHYETLAFSQEPDHAHLFSGT
jgi:predicted TIM-barrel fold metal-dependent hydrolase